MNTQIVKGKDGLWHQRAYGTRTTLCGQTVDPDVSPSISQLVFERLHGEKEERCFDCIRIKESGLSPIEFWKTHRRNDDNLLVPGSTFELLDNIIPDGI
ncbi:MAG TPA: hypothetical protein ENI27_02835 [bacterium]|nr:hypothetical protein [bacterium]